MKSHKTKYPIPTVRTVGQLNCGGKNAFSTTLGLQNMPGGEPLRNTSDFGEAWSKVHRTFSNNNSQSGPFFNSQSPRNAGEYTLNEPARFCNVTKVIEEHNLEHERHTAPTIETSESGVQVNIFHCQECRRHIEYGKAYKIQNTCSDSEQENNQLITNCPRCDRREGMVANEESSNRTETLFQRRASLYDDDSTPRDRSPSREQNLYQQSDTFSKNEAEMQNITDNVPQKMKFTEGFPRVLENLELSLNLPFCP